MRPQKAYQILNNICKNFYNSGYEDPTVRGQYNYGIGLLIKNELAVDQLLKIAKKDAYRTFLFFYEDGGSYVEDPCYYQIGDVDGVYSNLFYISDRWNCVGRLKYLKELIRTFKQVQ
jgi:hypothetical protein